MLNKILPLILIIGIINPAIAAGPGGLLESSTKAPLSDKEQEQANTYNHAGRTKRQIEESCADYDGYDDLCNNDQNAFKGGTMQTVELMVPIMSKAWAMFSGLGAAGGLEWTAKSKTGNTVYQDENGKEFTSNTDSKGKVTYQEPGAKDGPKMSEEQVKEKENVSEKKEKGTDYCQYIPMVGELATTAMGAMQAANTVQQYEASDANNRQIPALRATKKAQKDRAFTAKIQTGVWGSTGVCYTAMLAAGATANFGTVAKLGAAYVLTTFFLLKTKAHNKRADLIQEIIDSLPKQGECNPHTDTLCFCDEPTSFQFDPQNYAKYCLPHLLSKRGIQYPSVCVTANNKPDPDCKCKAAGACADRSLKLASVELGLNPALMKDAFSSMKPITEGTADGDFASNARRHKNIMKNALNKYNPEGMPKVSLSPDQKKLAKEYAKLGVPAKIAAFMAAKSGNASPPASLQSGNLYGGNNKLKKIIRSHDGDLQFKQNRLGSNNFKKKSRSAFPGKKPRRKRGAKIENLDSYFAEKATQAAQINKNSGKNIFEIVTYRYKMSAWKRFEEQISKEMNPEAKEESSKKPASSAP